MHDPVLLTWHGPPVLLLPGWQNSGPGHWQSRWEAQLGLVRVQQDDWLWPRRGDWMAQLEEAVLATPGPLALAAHSLGCHLVAAWAAHSAHAGRVQAALLVAPPDTTRDDLPPQLASWRRPVLQPLPFAAAVVASRDDPFASLAASQALAHAWGVPCHDAGPAGHLNADSGLGDWPAGLALLDGLCRQAVSRR